MVAKRKHRQRGRPKDIESPVDNGTKPDDYPTLLRYLQAKGRVRHVSYVHMMQARHLYFQGMGSERISEMMDGLVEPAIIDRWALMFAWDDERDRRLFDQFRRISGVDKPYTGDVKQRHERLAGSIEQYAERLLLQGQNGKKEVTARDLATLAGTISKTQEIRRVANGEDVDKKQQTVDINMRMPASIERLAGAILDAHDAPRIVEAQTRTIAIGTEDQIGSDTEFEDD